MAVSDKFKCWIEAMRLRTLPVSVAGVLTAVGMALADGGFRWLPATVCLLFAVLAQIASNFGNEYFDFRDGLDKKGRVGPRRGVTEGDITPQAMLIATFVTLGVASLLGLTLVYWGGWWLIAAGVVIVLGALAYSAGPYPLSRHGWGEVAVVLFFGVVPVTLTYYLQTGGCTWQVWLASVGMGLLGANVLVVNNYRDIEDDRAVGKKTLAVRFGKNFALRLYKINGYMAFLLIFTAWYNYEWIDVFPICLLAGTTTLHKQLTVASGRGLNPFLGKTSLLMFATSLIILCYGIIAYTL